MATGMGTPTPFGIAVVNDVGFGALSLPSVVVAARVPVGTRHVEPLLVTLAVGSVHLHGNAAHGEPTGRTTGRVSAPEHTSVAVLALIGRVVHPNLSSVSRGTNTFKVSLGFPDFVYGIHANTAVTTTAPSTIRTSLPGTILLAWANNTVTVTKTVTTAVPTAAGVPPTKKVNH